MSDSDPVIPSNLFELKIGRFRASKGGWKHISSREGPKTPPPSTIRVVTWNVECQTNWPAQRLTTALHHLETEVFKCKDGEAPDPCCILLQEVHVRAFEPLLENEWVRDHFMITPMRCQKWPQGAFYGNITLISKSLKVAQAQLVEFGLSRMQRTALVTDLKLSVPETNSRVVTLRVINTHLESLTEGAIARPAQLALVAKFLKQEGICGGIVGGDMNAIGPEDTPIVGEVGLRDAWRKGDEDERGFTWGYQGGGDFPPARLDKILFLPRRGYKVDEPRRVGVGVKTGDVDRQADAVWTSDHYGLVTTVRVFR
jgi:tyrosyl-DNA phosphodiesterase 2